MSTKEQTLMSYRPTNRPMPRMLYYIVLSNIITIKALKLSPVQPQFHRVDISIETRALNEAFSEAYSYYNNERSKLATNEFNMTLTVEYTNKLQSVTDRWLALEGQLRRSIPVTATNLLKVTTTSPIPLYTYTHILYMHTLTTPIYTYI